MDESVKLNDNQVKLSDGRIVTMRESTGRDDVAVAMMLGDKVSLQGAGAQVLIQANALRCVQSIDGQSPPIMKDYLSFISFADNFKTKDINKILAKYASMNLELDNDNPLV